MAEIYNCWQCPHYNHAQALCRKHSTSCGAFDPICEEFPKKVKKKKVLASSRAQLIAEEIKWLRLDPGCHDRMVYDSLSTIETMLKHLAATIKNTERDFEMEVITNE